jgi:nucleotide-binding universal stress UspA family protein
MSENFRILIAYDNSKYADAALEDLKFAGFAEENIEASIIIVAKIWLPPTDGETENPEGFLTEGLRKKLEKNLQILEDAKQIAQKTAEKVSSMFPGWKVESDATYGSPAWEILARANKFKPDLIVVGSQGLSTFQRIWLGSVSQKLVAEADCSVRVARQNEPTESSEIRLIIGFDGTDGAEKAVETVMNRKWKPDTKIRLVIAKDYELEKRAFDDESPGSALESRAEEIVRQFQELNLDASLTMLEDDPKDVIIQEADNFQANCIFVGATKFSSKMQRFLIGSVSSAITVRASCSVEVVRPNYYKSGQ